MIDDRCSIVLQNSHYLLAHGLRIRHLSIVYFTETAEALKRLREILCRGPFSSLDEAGKGLAFLHKLLEQRSRFPQLAVLLMKLLNPLQDFLKAYGVGIPHRSSPVGRVSIAVQINDVDIHGA